MTGFSQSALLRADLSAFLAQLTLWGQFFSVLFCDISLSKL